MHLKASGQGCLLKKTTKSVHGRSATGVTLSPVHTRVYNLDTAVKHFKAFLGDDDEYTCLEHISKHKAYRFS